MGWFQDNRKADGQFQERGCGRWFEYRKTDNWWAKQQGLQYVVAVGGLNEMRFANILKTVAYIAVDEDENGNAIIEKWQITNHRKYA